MKNRLNIKGYSGNEDYFEKKLKLLGKHLGGEASGFFGENGGIGKWRFEKSFSDAPYYNNTYHYIKLC